MKSWLPIVAGLGLALVGCSGQAPEHARPSPAKNAPQPSPTAPGQSATVGTPSAGCADEPPLALHAQAVVSPAGVGLSVIHAGTHTVKLASAVALLDVDGKVVNAEALHLQRSCTAETCVALDPGAELVSPPWLGSSDDERCGNLVRPAQPGSYQLVVRSCACKHEQRVVVQWPPQ